MKYILDQNNFNKKKNNEKYMNYIGKKNMLGNLSVLYNEDLLK